MAKYIVTGGCGFIGSRLVESLIKLAHEVVIIDDLSNGHVIHPKASFFKKDVTIYDDIEPLFSECDGCFHLAAIPTVEMTVDQWFDIHRINLQGSLNVFRCAISVGNLPVVYASSCGVYGNCTQLPLSEEQIIHPISAYGCDKYSTELNAYFLNHIYQLPTLGFRIFNVYGPGQRYDSPYSGVITHFIEHLRNNKPLIIYGDGKQTRDFIYVDDVVNILISGMTTLKHEAHVVNACTGKSVTINALANIMSKLYGATNRVQYLPARALDVQDSCGDPSMMHQYKLSAPTSLEEGLMKLKKSMC